ncbi:MAG: hypothetical protein DSZ32_01180 [Gammaproteobacteria bacterium]|nr:MAG: hypothetical protein DSZ32_01180 [Gammaproteobacteria bacterium]
MPTILRWVLKAVPWLTILLIVIFLIGVVFRIHAIVDPIKGAGCMPVIWAKLLAWLFFIIGALALAAGVAGMAGQDQGQHAPQTLWGRLKHVLDQNDATPLSRDLGLWARVFLALFLLAIFFRC